ncbi:MAG: Eco57I restriction-modification methylase domain-containing protein, partial [Sphaerospermopsis kisseleviana]
MSKLLVTQYQTEVQKITQLAQNKVSSQLSEQVLEALWELLRGFQAADAAVNGQLLREIAEYNPQHIYGGLITILLRLVFLLYAEDRGLMSQDEVYIRDYSVTGLYEKLREDASNFPDTMDQRYGAWAWLLSLFKLVYSGSCHAKLSLPAREGQLFDPNEYPFLEGLRSLASQRSQEFEATDIPRISDGVIFRVLQGLLVLDGERLSYCSLDVEQIGSMYEEIMGYEVRMATSASIGVWSKPKSAKASVTVVVSVDDILKTKAGDRVKYLKEQANCEITGKSLTELKEAKTAEEVVNALGRKVSPKTPSLMAVGSLYLQPGEERRRSGSHYTPRALTAPIVTETLRPVFENLGENPTSEDILNLKVCDLAMGSGAFLVEVCRQIAEKVVEVWEKQGNTPVIPEDEDVLLFARRVVAQRCLYGVDKNPFAVNLAKLSLWLVTLAKNHTFTFLDHALKCGDSLVGLTREQIKNFSWIVDTTHTDESLSLPLAIDNVKNYRNEIVNFGDDEYGKKREKYENVEKELEETRVRSDLVIAAFFAAEKDKARKDKLDKFRLMFAKVGAKHSDKNIEEKSRISHPNASPVKESVEANPLSLPQQEKEEIINICNSLKSGEKPVSVFNWEIEFPEVFDSTNPGFDAIVGNPPFAGKNTTINGNIQGYLDWLKVVNPESHGNADLAAHFFRKAFDLLRKNGTFGLIATNTIAQGDTRSTGLRYICEHGGIIYNAQKRLKWPGLAAVVVSVVHCFKGEYVGKKLLDNKQVDLISAFLFHAGGNKDPKKLIANAGKSFIGSIVLGMGFTFDDDNPEATPIAEMQRLITENPKNAERIFPYIGGEEVNSSPTHVHWRYVINFGEMSEEEARQYPDLINIVEEKVKPERAHLTTNTIGRKRAEFWWKYGSSAQELYNAISQLNRVLVISRHQPHWCTAFMEANIVFSEALVVFANDKNSFFCILQSRIHEIWTRFFGSSLEDRLRYTPSDCFETFPFPENWENNQTLEAAGKTYYEYRAELMVKNNQGLTETYNRFHDPDEYDPDIIKLRELHTAMDKEVLNAYGWGDISTECEFLLDYEEEDLTPDISPTKRGERSKKKPWRYRWPESIHDEVLAKLLELNQKRYESEILGGKVAEGKKKGKSDKKKTVKNTKT